MSSVPKPPAEEHRDLVAVFDTQQESEAMVVQGLLESAGIESLITALDAPQDVLPGVGGVQVRVPPQDEEEARRVIAESRDSAPETIEEPSEPA